jgi:hypothetical protein
MIAFFDFPAEHWDHLRTSKPIESVFATVRHRTVRTKESLSATIAKLMMFKLVTAAAKTWRRLKGENRLPKVVQGVRFQTASRSSKCRLATPPDRPRNPISGRAPSACRLRLRSEPFQLVRHSGLRAGFVAITPERPRWGRPCSSPTMPPRRRVGGGRGDDSGTAGRPIRR